MTLTFLDLVVSAVTLLATVGGVFVGFSGSLAFLAGLSVSVLGGIYTYPYAEHMIENGLLRVFCVALAGIVVFGLVRGIVKRFVRGLVAQPGDAIIGALISGITVASFSLGILWLISFFFGTTLDSTFLDIVRTYVGW